MKNLLSPTTLKAGFFGAAGALALSVAMPVAGGTAFTAASSLLTASPAHASKIKFKGLSVKHRTRGRPIVTVRLRDGRWRASGAVMHMDLKVVLKSKKSRILSVDIEIGGRRFSVRRGKLVNKLTLSPLRIGLASHALGSHASGAAKACGKLMKNRNGSRRFNHNIKVTFIIGNKKGKKAAKAVHVSGFLDCRR